MAISNPKRTMRPRATNLTESSIQSSDPVLSFEAAKHAKKMNVLRGCVSGELAEAFVILRNDYDLKERERKELKAQMEDIALVLFEKMEKDKTKGFRAEVGEDVYTVTPGVRVTAQVVDREAFYQFIKEQLAAGDEDALEYMQCAASKEQAEAYISWGNPAPPPGVQLNEKNELRASKIGTKRK